MVKIDQWRVKHIMHITERIHIQQINKYYWNIIVNHEEKGLSIGTKLLIVLIS